MKLNTSVFGEIEVSEEQIIRFPGGIPGFEELEQFAYVEWEDSYPFSYLISVDDPKIGFLTAEPFVFFKDYEFELSEMILEELGVVSQKDVMVRAIISAEQGLEDATANLMAPIVVNMQKKAAKQVVLHQSPYSTKHKLIASVASK